MDYSEEYIGIKMRVADDGEWVTGEDYDHALGVIRKLRSQIEKKKRREQKKRVPSLSSKKYLTLNEIKNIKVGDVYFMSGYEDIPRSKIVIVKTYNKEFRDYGFDCVIEAKGLTRFTIGSRRVVYKEVKLERV
jgi:hypothetical protein